MHLRLFIFIAFISPALSATPMVIQLGARDLDIGDVIWGPDAYVNVKYALANNPWTSIGSTEVLSTKNPNWAATFSFSYVDHMDQHLQFDIMDDDLFYDDRLGSVTFRMVDIANATELETNFGKGRLLVRNVASVVKNVVPLEEKLASHV